MFASERRTTFRRKLQLPLRFHRQNALAEDENGATSVKVSASGVYFISSLSLSVGEKIEVSMKMPRKVTGQKPSKRLFTGRVTHVNSQGAPPGFSRIGVHLLYCVLESVREQSCDVALQVRQWQHGGRHSKTLGHCSKKVAGVPQSWSTTLSSVDETRFSEFVHENIDATARCPHQFRQRFLWYFANDWFRLAFFSMTCQQEKSTCQSFLSFSVELKSW
jgi:hypothetical protein